jgi:hypothetical protein
MSTEADPKARLALHPESIDGSTRSCVTKPR